jgi:membrane associated rhomboid family serine protease
MRRLGRFSIALLCSLAALAGSYFLGSLFLMLLDSNYHDGFAAVGGLVIGLIVAVVVFNAVWKKLKTWAYTSPDQSSQIPR